MTGKLIVGVDVGGTFTDLFFLDEATGRIYAAAWCSEIHVMQDDGSLLYTIPTPGVGTNDLDLDVALAPVDGQPRHD